MRINKFSSQSVRSLAILLVCFLCLPQFVFAATGAPKILNYQGRLMDSSGVLLGGAGTEYCFRFSFYDTTTVGTGSKLWPSASPSTMTISVKNGVFNAGIGDTVAGGDTLDFNFQDTDTVFLNVDVASKVGATCAPGDGAESYETLGPRQRIYSSGFAINASTLGGYNAQQIISLGFSTTSADFLISQRNFFSTTSVQYFASVTNFFSTSSTDYWKTQNNFFSTTSADYYSANNNSFSTTSASYFADASTTIPKTYTNNTFTGYQNFANASATNASTTNISAGYASSTQGFFGSLSVGALTGILKATAGVVASGFVNLATEISGILPVANGGTGWSNFAAGAVVYGNGSGSLATTTAGLPGQVLALLNGVPTWTATTTFSGPLNYSNGNVSIDTSGDWTGTLDGYSATQLIALGFSTTSADYWTTERNFFATSSADYWKTQNNFFSTTSANYFVDSSTTVPKTYTSNTFSLVNFFSGGFAAYASSTIGDGTERGGLTVSGAATTTGTAYFASRVGVGTALPQTSLDVRDQLFVRNVDGVVGSNDGVEISSDSSAPRVSLVQGNRYVGLFSADAPGNTYLKNVAGGALIFNGGASGNTEIMRLTNEGFLGIGTTSPGSALSVQGNQFIAGNIISTSSLASVFPFASSSALTADALFSTNALLENATTTSFAISNINSGSLLKVTTGGSVVAAVGGVDYLTLANIFSTTSTDYWKTQNNFFSTTSSDFLATQRNFFSTTSADFYKSANNFFSTTSADFLASQRNFFSTSSAIFFADSSTTIAKTYANNAFNGYQTFTNASTTNASTTLLSAVYASSTNGFFGNLSIGTLTGVLKATAGIVSSGLVSLTTEVSGILPVANGGTGWNDFAAGAVVYGNGSGSLATTTAGLPGQVLALLNGVPTWTATTTFSGPLNFSNGNVSIDTSGDWTGTLDGYSSTQLIALGFSTTSADYWTSERNFFSTTSADYLASQRNFFSTTSVDFYKTANNFFSTTSSDFLATQRNFFSTTSSDFWKTVNNFFSTTSAAYFASVNQGASFSTTSATYFADSSTTIAKTYTNNSFAGYQNFANSSTTNASTTLLSASYASSTNAFFGNLSVGVLSGVLRAAAGVVSTGLVNLASEVTGILPVINGGTGWGNVAAGAVLYGNGTGALSTTTAALPGQTLAYLNGVPTWTSTTTFSGGLAYSAGNVSLDATYDKGFFFSTTSTDYWKTQNNFYSTTSADYFLTQRNTFSTTSADYLATQRNYFSTTSTDFWKTVNDFFSTTSADYLATQRNSFSTTSAIYFTDASTTIPKTYSTNLFSALQMFSTLTATSATTTSLFGNSILSNFGAFNILTATTSATFASTTAYGRFITGNVISTSTATSTFNGPLSVGIATSSHTASILGNVTGGSGTVGTAVMSITNSNTTLSSGTNVLRLNVATPGQNCNINNTCPRFIEFFSGTNSGSDIGGTGLGRIGMSNTGNGITQTSGAADFAEYMQLNSAASVGDLVSLNSAGEYQKAVAGQSLIGVISDNPAFVGNGTIQDNVNAYVVGFAGVIKTTVSASSGPIVAGDFIAASTTGGVGVKLLNSGFALGQALESYSGAGLGTINVLVLPKYIDAAVALESYGGTSGGVTGYWSLSTSTGYVTLASSTYSLIVPKATITYASTTALSSSYASSTQAFFGSLSVGALNGVLRATGGVISSGFVNLASEVSGILPIANGGTGTSSIPTYGKLLIGNSLGGYDYVSTSSLGIISGTWGLITGNINDQTDLQNEFATKVDVTADKGFFFSTTSTDAFASQRNFFSTTSADFYISQANLSAFSTSSADYWKTLNNFFSTTSADFLASQRNYFSTTSSDYYKSANNFYSTTSADYFITQRNTFSTTSADYLATQRNSFSTTSAIYFVDASSTIAKTYANNAFSGYQTFANSSTTNASTTNVSAVYASSTNAFFGNLTVGALNGVLRAAAGVVSSGLVNLASEVTGILPVTNGGTGWGNVAAGAILYGDGTNALATTTAGLPGQTLALLNGVPTWTSTTTFSGALVYSNGNVTLDTSGNWSGTLGGYTATQLLAAGFSTTSTDYWQTQRNFFSTTSADFYKSANNFFSTTSADFLATQRNFFSTTSADFYKTSNNFFSSTSAAYFADSSTTIPKTYSTNTFTGNNTFSGQVTVGTLNGPLQANNGVVSASSTIGVVYGGTGWSNFVSGALLYGNGTNALATTTAGTAGQILALLNGVPTWTSTTTFSNGLSYANGAVSLDSNFNKGFFFSTTSTDYYKLANNFFSTTSADYFVTQRSLTGFSTTSSDYYKSVNNFFSTTSTDYWKTLNNFFSTTSASYFVDASTTIPKTYTSNTFSLLNAFNAGITAYSSSTIGNGTLTGGLTVSGGATTTGTAYFAGLLGIGTTSPGSALSIGNVANFTTATSSIYGTGGFNLQDGCYAIDGVCLVGPSGSDLALTRQDLDTRTTLSTVSTTTLITLAVNPPTITADEYITVTGTIESASNTDGATDIAIRKTSCAGTVLSNMTLAVTLANGVTEKAFSLSAVDINPGTSAQTYVLCARGITIGEVVKGSSMQSLAIDTAGSSGGASGVSSVSNPDGTLTISPTTGAVSAALNLANANTWTGLQQFYGFASSSLFSSHSAFFGATATTTIDSAGNVSVAGTLGVNGLATLGYASTTMVSAATASSTNLTVSSVRSSLVTTDAQGNASSYGGSSCTNQFVRSINGAGVATCASVADSDFTGQLSAVHGGTGIGAYVAGDILYANTPSSLARIASTTSGTVLALVNGIPTWTATTTFSNGLAFANGNVTFSAPASSALTISYASTTALTATNASTTNLTVSSIRSSLIATDAAGNASAYAGTSACTNQFIRSINGAGTATCATVTNNDLQNSSVNFSYAGIASGDASVALGGTININASSSPTVGYVWATSTTKRSQLPYASSTAFTADNLYATAATSTYISTMVASSSIFFGSMLATCQSGFFLTWNAGIFGCGQDQQSAGGGTFPFTPTSVFGAAANATSTLIGFNAGLYSTAATSTIANLTIVNSTTTAATTTRLAIASVTSGILSTDVNGAVGKITIGSGISYSANSLALDLSAQNIWSGLQKFQGNASTTQISAGLVYIGGTATTTIDTVGNITFGNSSANIILQNGVDHALNFATSTANVPALSISTRTSSVGLVGIGTSTPWGKLSVEMGTLDPAFVVSNQGSSSPAFYIGSASSNGRIGVGTSSPWAQFSIDSGAGVSNSPLLSVGSTSATYFLINNGGNVGVGTTSPAGKFAVNGSVFVTGTTTTMNGINIQGGCFAVNGVCIRDTVTRLTGVQMYVASTTWNKPAGLDYAVVEVWGAGGGGGGGDGTGGAAGGGGSGGYSMIKIPQASLGASVTVDIGAAGAAGTNAGGNGGIGGGSGFRGFAYAQGGQGGIGSGSNSTAVGLKAGGAGAAAGSGGDINWAGFAGSQGEVITAGTALYSGNGASAPRGGAGGAAPVAAAAGGNGQAPGGGGSGGFATSNAGNTGGTGGAGGVAVYEYTTVTSGSDLAENYPVSDPTIAAGDIVAFDRGLPITLKRANRLESRPLAGIITTAPGMVLGEGSDIGQRAVALSGRVPAKVNLEGGAIAIGDRIALSSIPGVGKKGTAFEDSVGIAIDSFDGTGSSTVMVFMDLQRGIDINSIAFGLLTGSTTATSTQAGPLDFVGGMMQAIGARLSSLTFAGTSASSTATTTDTIASSTPNSVDNFAQGLLQSIFDKIIQILSTAGNGIGSIFANAIHAKEQICVDDQCLSRDDVQAMLKLTKQKAQTASVTSSTSGTATNTNAPVLEIQGNNPATINVGATYNDLGAIITSPAADVNLGITYLVDGLASAAVQIDTSFPAEHTVTYRVIDPAGYVGEATRTVRVVDLNNLGTASTTSPTEASSTPETTAPSTPVTSASSTPSTDSASPPPPPAPAPTPTPPPPAPVVTDTSSTTSDSTSSLQATSSSTNLGLATP